jgi:CheY-like chemotaxis protein
VAAQREECVQRDPPLDAAYTEGVRILFVENHQAFAETVAKQFLAEHEVVVVATVSEARSRLVEWDFDAVLVDYDLDDGKGTLLAEFLRSAGFGGVVVAVSSHDEGNQALVRAGAAAICPKAEFSKIASVLKATAAKATGPSLV